MWMVTAALNLSCTSLYLRLPIHTSGLRTRSTRASTCMPIVGWHTPVFHVVRAVNMVM